MAGPRCPDCNKFVPLETQDPEVENIEIDADGNVTISVRLVRACAECGTEMRETTLELEESVDIEHTHVESDPRFTIKEVVPGQFRVFDTVTSQEVAVVDSRERADTMVEALKSGQARSYHSDGTPAPYEPEDEDDFELEVEETSSEVIERSEGKGRYCKTFYGAEVSFQVTCSCGEQVIESSASDYCQASHFDDLT